MSERDLQQSMTPSEEDLAHLADRLHTHPDTLTEVWPALTSTLLDRAAGLAYHLSEDAEAAQHPWSPAAVQGHTRAAEWLAWLLHELTEEAPDE